MQKCLKIIFIKSKNECLEIIFQNEILLIKCVCVYESTLNKTKKNMSYMERFKKTVRNSFIHRRKIVEEKLSKMFNV